ncbi:hypothetical protein DBB36_10790 [Flavobacterium sp. WLB]|uniref:hypothetical protein n=1 Tax=unclassified Flavobacterium TaxID=196869 RepID=UPI0006ABC9E8|nr:MULTISPECIES: hypothetical protein [unclassified Flavobacterium]KOP37801.1 hypothetical protein AKO67_13035 [Flavobacterium sp. VMW]OWU90968.1 hypothetical protein APR43_10865 [Flavobacterium sp. NLM]PUU70032.1 hypothetical protein DBB36_10790 [Flavobacterium sp. WLB]
MIQNFTLSSTNAEDATSTLSELISDPWTFLVVLGNSTEAQNALQICYKKINSGHPYYKGVRCIHIPIPSLVLPLLKSLRVKPEVQIDWNNSQNYLITCISAVYNNIGYIYSAQNYFNIPEAKTDRLVLKALAADLSI